MGYTVLRKNATLASPFGRGAPVSQHWGGEGHPLIDSPLSHQHCMHKFYGSFVVKTL